MYKYSIVLIYKKLSEGDKIKLNDVRHLTIKRRFKTDKHSLIKLKKILKKIFSKIKPVTVETGEIDTFEKNGGKLCYLSIRNEDEIIKLHEMILEYIDKLVKTRDRHFEGENFTPHITLEFYKDQVDTKDISSDVPKIHTFNHMYLLSEVNRKEGLWEVLKKFNLNI